MKRDKSFSKRMTAVILASLMTASLFTGCSFFDNRTSGKEEKPTQQEQNTGADNKAPNSENKAENATPSAGNDENQSGSQSGNNSGNPSTTPPSLEIVQQADADYEEWLAAAMLIGVSMEYPDFKFDGLYTSSETSIESKANSDGVYIVFESKGKKMALHSSALDGERNTAGTKDLSTQALGFETFDSVDPSSVRTESMTKLDVADLEELINQSLLVSVHAR